MNINDIITESQHACPHCGGPVFEYSELTEKKDACYYKVKASAKVWPSAYASGRLVQCRKKGAANYGNKSESVAEDTDKKCPPATQDITLNLKNRQKAINEYGYGPLNPDMPNTKFWMKKVDEWNLDSTEEAKQSLCGNCAAFDIRQDTLDCIAQGIDSDSPADAEGVIAAGDLGYCKFLKFKCASRRTCDAWVTGGPLTDNKPGVEENFADGKGPGRPGDSVRHGIPKKATMAELEKASRSAGRKGQLARWQLNMRRGKSKRRNESVAEGADDEIHNYKKLDHILATLCELVIQGHQHDPEKYGMVAACVLDPDNRVATGINLPAHDGKRQHAERVAIDKYHTEYGKIPPGSIILTTCSPCSEYMGERYGEDCTQLINSTGVKKVYCGFDDPTQSEQHREFNCTETANSQIRTLCSKFAEQFLNTGSKNPVSEAVVKKSNLKTYAARVKLKQTGYTNIVDATVMARNPEMARRLLHQLYGGNSSVVGQPREIK